ncbi:MAG TPA: peptide ligase PGM1-related protein [Chitinophagales bacterium]|nr:peptide ligase PGM1-related protein [Chitinophagales bacterium]
MHQASATQNGFQQHDFFSPAAGSDEERNRFHALQQTFASEWEDIFPNVLAEKTIVIIPSLSVDQEILSKVKGSVFYEERLLCLLMLLRMPRTHIIYVTSIPIDPVIVDYYLHLLPGITGYHAQQRLTMLSCFDASAKSLTEKILERPRLIERIRNKIPGGHLAHIICFNMTNFERSLAVRLELPIYGCDPDLLHFGTKSGSRKIFRECNITIPDGFEDLRDEADIVDALTELKEKQPSLKKAVVKLNEGFSGEGNAIFSFEKLTGAGSLKNKILHTLQKELEIVAGDIPYDSFLEKFRIMNGVVEEFIPGEVKHSPSVQCRINPLGHVEVLSTHDQLLGGDTGQVFIGANFPAHPDYAKEIGIMGREIGHKLKDHGVIGRFGADFISVRTATGWKHYALELNLRKGGTTHPFLMLQGLTVGNYNVETGIYLTANGQQRYYFSSDNLRSDIYRGLTPHDLMDIAITNRLQYDGSLQQGVMFHLMGALSRYGKLGVVCIGDTASRANAFYRRTVQVLNKEGRNTAY